MNHTQSVTYPAHDPLISAGLHGAAFSFGLIGLAIAIAFVSDFLRENFSAR